MNRPLFTVSARLQLRAEMPSPGDRDLDPRSRTRPGEGHILSRIVMRIATAIAELRVNSACERLVRKGILVRNGRHPNGSRRYELTALGRLAIDAQVTE